MADNASAPPDKSAVLAADGITPIVGTDKILFMPWLKAAEKRLPKEEKEFHSLYTKGYITRRLVIVASAEHAEQLATQPTPITYTWRNPAPIQPRTNTPRA